MMVKPFHFKQFTVHQDRCTHKVGTDGVLLGSWVQIRDGDDLILDLGTGSGLIALMLAQRTNVRSQIHGIDIEEQDIQQAIANVAQSPWPHKISLWQTAAQDFFPPHQYNLIVSNPPYFINSLRPPDEKRSHARHALALPFEDLVKTVSRLLKPKGRFAVILPVREGEHFTALAATVSLYPLRKSNVRSRSHKPVERVLLEFSREHHEVRPTEIIIHGKDDAWSPEYSTLTRDYYVVIDADSKK